MLRHQLQFELWEECNSKCSFCYLGNNNRYTSNQQKILNLEETIKHISDLNIYKDINCLGYIGGEFFQGQLNDRSVKNKFIELMEKTSNLLENQYIDEVWLSASLLIGNQKDLYEVLEIFKKNISKIWILTSYDTIGRFHSKKEKDDWIYNLSNLRKKYDNIKINITSIVTGDFIQQYLNKTLDIYKIANQFNCSVFLKPVAKIEGIDDKALINSKISNFFPKRKDMLQFLTTYKLQEGDFLYDKLFNMQYRADYLKLFGHRQNFSHRIKNKYEEESWRDEGKQKVLSMQNLSCGHSFQYQCYIDSDRCLICDKEMIKKSL